MLCREVKPMRNVLAALLLAWSPSIGLAQVPAGQASPAERDAVLAAVQKFFDTMAAGDVPAGRAGSIPEGRFFSLRTGQPGAPPTLRSFTNQESYDRMASDKRKLQERMWNPEVRIHGPIAVVWTAYDFWIDGKFSHCGVDAFNLVKTPDGWKLAGGLYTVEPNGCSPSPLGPLK
jgi:hypothetical protein